MWKLPIIVLVVVVTTVNAWMNWRLWRERAAPVVSDAPAALIATPAQVAPRALGTREIFRPQRRVIAARPPWSELESEDYAEYARNLRRIGCPETTVRDILVADIAGATRAQIRAIHDESGDPFWLTAEQRDDRSRMRVRREWEVRLRKWSLLRELFPHPVDEEVLAAMREDGMVGGSLAVMAGYVERESFIRAFGAARYYAQQLKAVEQVTEGILLESDYARARQIRDQMQASLTALVGGENLQEIFLRLLAAESGGELPTARHGFVVSGSELRKLMEIRLAARDVLTEIIAREGFPDLQPATVTDEEVETAIARYLGKDRFADYLRAKDERYQGIHIFAVENGLSRKEAIAVFEERARADDEIGKLRTAKDLSAEEIVLLQAALKARVEATVRRVFGPVIAKEYLADGASSWIGELITVPEPAQKPAGKEVAR